MSDLTSIPVNLKSDSARQRERTIMGLAPAMLQEPQIIAALQTMAVTDPIQYVRESAINQLTASGQVEKPIDPRTYELQVKEEKIISVQAEMIIDRLSVESAKQRERVINEIPPRLLQEQNLLSVLNIVATRDPVEYVRIAAVRTLAKVGYTPVGNTASIQFKQEGIDKIVFFVVLGVTIIITALVSIFVLALQFVRYP